MTVHRRLNGRRGVFLAIFGAIYVAIGLSYVFPSPSSTIRHTLAWLPGVSLAVFGLAWVCAGSVAVAAAFQPLPQDRFGFEALAGVAVGWAIVNLTSYILGDSVRGWVSALIFAALAASVLTVSGMLNPPHGRRG